MHFLKESLQHFSSFSFGFNEARFPRDVIIIAKKCQIVLVILLRLLEQQQQKDQEQKKRGVDEEGLRLHLKETGEGRREMFAVTALLSGRVPEKITQRKLRFYFLLLFLLGIWGVFLFLYWRRSISTHC